jgi:hypothetical protein
MATPPPNPPRPSPNSRPKLDFTSAATIGVTLVLFVVAIFVHGLTEKLLLEAGVFLVSVKLILMSYKGAATAAETRDRLETIERLLSERPTNAAPLDV